MKKYISPFSWFSFEYPDTWNEFEDEEGSFLFYDPEHWTGNFRISASQDASPDFARDAKLEELSRYPDTQKVQIGQLEYTYNKETFQENNQWYTSHFWVSGVKNIAVYATFTVPKGESIDVAVQILESLRLMNPMNPQCSEIIPIRLMEIVIINEAYEWALKAVKNAFKKDFSSSVADSITYLQHLIDEDKIKIQRDTREKLALLLGSFLVEEMDGVQWVTVIDGREEYPALLFGGEIMSVKSVPLSNVKDRLINPVTFIENQLAQQDTDCNLQAVYDALIIYKWTE